MTRERRDRENATGARGGLPRRRGGSGGGARLTRVGGGRATAALDGGRGDVGLAAEAVVAVGSAAALAAGASAAGGPRDSDARPPPRVISLSLELFRDDPHGALTAEAALSYRGRGSMVVDVEVRDAESRLVAALVVTQLTPGPPQAWLAG
jgi:hypothetical protein